MSNRKLTRRVTASVSCLALALQLLVSPEWTDLPVNSAASSGFATHVESTAVALAAPLLRPDGPAKLMQPSGVRVDRRSATSLKVWWSKVPGARSYKVYRLVKSKWKLVKTTSSLSWINKKLPKRKVQQYRVVACSWGKGKGVCSGASPTVSAITNATVKDKKVNVRTIWIVGLPRELSPLDNWRFGVELTPSVWGVSNPGLQEPVSLRLGMVSSDPSVVSVESLGPSPNDGTGSLTAKKVGSAVITVTAHNGLSKSVRLYVRDTACPVVVDDYGLGTIDENPVVGPMLKAHGAQICDLTSYVMSHSVGAGLVSLDERGVMTVEGDLRLPDDQRESVRDILSTGSVYPVQVDAGPFGVAVHLYTTSIPWGEEGSARIVLDYSPYDYDQLGRPPTTHWKVFSQMPAIRRSAPRSGQAAYREMVPRPQ